MAMVLSTEVRELKKLLEEVQETRGHFALLVTRSASKTDAWLAGKTPN